MARTQEPGYWENSFRLWHGSYQHNKYRNPHVVDVQNFVPDFDSHDLKFDHKMPSQHRNVSRLYKSPYNDVPYPRECAKLVSKYYECRRDFNAFSLTEDVPQCSGSKAHVFEGCPHWVLENLALKRKFFKRAEQIDFETYKRAMVVSDYNKQQPSQQKMNVPLGLSPYHPPISEKYHPQLTVSLLLFGFFLFSWLFIYQLTVPKSARSLTREIILAAVTSISWGFAALFGLLWAGLYV